MSYNTRQSCVRVLRCHSGRTKRIITEDSPDLFLTVAEVSKSSTSFSNLLTEWRHRMAKCVNTTCVHHTHAHRARALHPWWSFRTSCQRLHYPRSPRTNLSWVVSRHMYVLIFECFRSPLSPLNITHCLLDFCPLVSINISCIHNCDTQAHLFDRRHTGRYLHEEWGMPPDERSATTCVRRFGRRSRAKSTKGGPEHVTGARLSTWNGHEVCHYPFP